MGRYSKQLDQALPANHVRNIYDHLKRGEAQIIAQLRTGKCRLNSYLHSINAADSEQCQWCQRRETVRHFLVECQQWMSAMEHRKSAVPAGHHPAVVGRLISVRRMV